jgi:hypothetical protein
MRRFLSLLGKQMIQRSILNSEGITLLELLLSITISTMIVGIAFTLFSSVQKTFNTVIPKQSVRYDVDYAFQRISKDLTNASQVTVNGSPDANGYYSSITIIPRDISGNQLLGNQVRISAPTGISSSTNGPLIEDTLDGNGNIIKHTVFGTYGSNFSATRFVVTSSTAGQSVSGTVEIHLSANSITNTKQSVQQVSRIVFSN